MGKMSLALRETSPPSPWLPVESMAPVLMMLFARKVISPPVSPDVFKSPVKIEPSLLIISTEPPRVVMLPVLTSFSTWRLILLMFSGLATKSEVLISSPVKLRSPKIFPWVVKLIFPPALNWESTKLRSLLWISISPAMLPEVSILPAINTESGSCDTVTLFSMTSICSVSVILNPVSSSLPVSNSGKDSGVITTSPWEFSGIWLASISKLRRLPSLEIRTKFSPGTLWITTWLPEVLIFPVLRTLPPTRTIFPCVVKSAALTIAPGLAFSKTKAVGVPPRSV